MATLHVGGQRIITFETTDADDNLMDCSGSPPLVAIVARPSGGSLTIPYPSAEWVRVSLGRYKLTVTCAKAGAWEATAKCGPYSVTEKWKVEK